MIILNMFEHFYSITQHSTALGTPPGLLVLHLRDVSVLYQVLPLLDDTLVVVRVEGQVLQSDPHRVLDGDKVLVLLGLHVLGNVNGYGKLW